MCTMVYLYSLPQGITKIRGHFLWYIILGYNECQEHANYFQGHVCGACYVTLEQGCRATLPPKQDSTPDTSTLKTPTASKRKGVRSPQKTPSTTRQSKNIRLSSSSKFVPRSTSTPFRPESRESCKEQKEHALFKALRSSQYYTVFRNILSRGAAAKRAFSRLVKNTVAEEVKSYSKHAKDYRELNGVQDIANFSWDSLNDDVNKKMPNFYASLDGALNAKLWRRKKPLSEKQMAKHR